MCRGMCSTDTNIGDFGGDITRMSPGHAGTGKTVIRD